MSEILSDIIMKYLARYDNDATNQLGFSSVERSIYHDGSWHEESENPNVHWWQYYILIPKSILYIVLTRLTDARFMTIKDQWIPASRRVRKVDNTEAKRWMPWFWPRARRVGLTRNGLSGERWTRGLQEGREMGSPARPLCNNKSPNSSCQDIPLGQ